MNELHLVDNFYLRVLDKNNFITIEKATNKKGEQTERRAGYHGTLQGALKSSLDKAIKSSCEPLTVKTILNRIDNLHKTIEGLKYEHITKLFKEFIK